MHYIPMKLEKYEIIAKLISNIKKLKAFEDLSSKDLFIFKYKNKEYAIVFIKNYGGNTYGISLFSGDDGFNTLYDMFTVENKYSLLISDYCSTNIMLCKKKVLQFDEEEYLNKKNIKIKNKDNLIVRTYKKGYASRIANNLEADEVILILEFLFKVISVDGEAIINGFKTDMICYYTFDNNKKGFARSMIPMPYLERHKPFVKESPLEIEEFSDYSLGNDEGCFICKNIEVPVKVKNSNVAVTPLFIIYATKQNGLVDCETITSTPEEYRSYLIPILSEFFKSKQLPKSITINNRDLYYDIHDLLVSIGIDVILQIENKEYDSFLYTVSKATSSFFDLTINDSKIFSVDDSSLRDLFSFIKKMIRNKDSIYEATDDESLKMDLFESIVDMQESVLDEENENDLKEDIDDEDKDTHLVS